MYVFFSIGECLAKGEHSNLSEAYSILFPLFPLERNALSSCNAVGVLKRDLTIGLPTYLGDGLVYEGAELPQFVFPVPHRTKVDGEVIVLCIGYYIFAPRLYSDAHEKATPIGVGRNEITEIIDFSRSLLLIYSSIYHQ